MSGRVLRREGVGFTVQPSPTGITPDVRKSLSIRVFHRWLFPALAEWVVIVTLFAMGYAAHHVVVWLVVIVLLGSRMHALGILGHDGAHYTASRNRAVNDIATEVLCFWPLFTGLHDFRRFHLEHHRHFGDGNRDPELVFKHKWSTRQWALPTTRERIIARFLMDLMGFGLLEVAKMLLLVGRRSLRSWVGPLAWWGIVGGILHLNNLDLVIVVWAAAFCTSFWGFYRFRMWTEHIGTTSTHRLRVNWWQRYILTPHGSWSHFEHHGAPSVPFWRRPELRPREAETVSIGELFAYYDSCAMAATVHGSSD